MRDPPRRPSRWSTDGSALYAAIACACVVAVWAPLAVSFVRPVWVLDAWGAISGYFGIAWLTPAALFGLALSRAARDRGIRHPIGLGAVAGVVIAIGLLVLLASRLAAIEGRWDARESPVRVSQPVLGAPEDLVRDGADRPLRDVLCHPISNGSYFCAVTYEGPACQLFSVTGGGAMDLPPVVEGATARRTSKGVRCSSS